jgi:branched-chain amino acid transport system substrate-binding protein
MLWVLFAVTAALLLGCGGSAKSDVVKIGVAGPLTGSQAKMGADIFNGVKLAVQQWNEKGGVLGKKIEIVGRDDEAKEPQAKTVAFELINAGVVGVIGHFNSGCTIPASEEYFRNNIPIITPSSTNPYVTDRKYWNVFRICGRDDAQGERAAIYAVEKLKVQRVVVLHDKTAYGEGLAGCFKKAVEKLAKPENIVYYGGIDKSETNFKSLLSTIKEKNPDSVFFGGIYDQAGLLVLQMRDGGITVPFISGDGVIDTEYLKTAGKSADNSYLTFPELLPFAKGIYEKFPEARKFNEEYAAKFKSPGPYSLYAYDAANILISSIQKAGTTEGKKLAETIRSTEHNCCMGKIKFDDKGDILGSFYAIWGVKDGEFVFVEK